MKLELKHLAVYLPYGLKCQYEGILNGREMSRQRKEYARENDPFPNWEYFEPVAEIKGLKIAPLTTIRVFKKYWMATCGVSNHGQKVFYSGTGLTPILRPLSDLTKEELIEQGFSSHIDYLTQQKQDHLKAPFFMVQYLLSKHFDIFGLIENGLAIDINTITK